MDVDTPDAAGPPTMAPRCDDRDTPADRLGGGQLLWKAEHRLQANAGPTLDKDGNLYLHAKRIAFWVDEELPTLLSYTPQGQRRWSAHTHTTDNNTGNIPAPIIAGEELWIPAAQNDYDDDQGRLYRFDTDGNELGDSELPGRPRRFSALAGDTLYFPGNDGLHALDANGAARWQAPVSFVGENAAASHAVVGPDGTIYVATDKDDTKLYAIDPSGSVRWTRDLGRGARSDLAVDHDGNVYQGIDYRRLPDGSKEWPPFFTATDKDGNELWTLPDAPDRPLFWDSIQIDEQGVVYAGGVLSLNPIDQTVTYGVFALKHNPGSSVPQILWRKEFDDLGLTGAFAISRGGLLYFTDVCKYLYALDRQTGEVAWVFELPEEDLVHVDDGSPRLCAGFLSSPTLARDGTIYFSAGGQIVSGRLYAVSGDGTGISCDAPWPGEQGGLSKDGRVR